MKKILAIIATIGLVGTASSSVVSFVKTPERISTKTNAKEVNETNMILNEEQTHSSFADQLGLFKINTQLNQADQPKNPEVYKLTSEGFESYIQIIFESLTMLVEDNEGREPQFGKDYFSWLSDDGNTIGFWLSEENAEFFTSSNWLFYIVSDLSALSLNIDLDQPGNNGVGSVQNKIVQIIRNFSPDAIRGIDYTIPTIPFGTNGEINKVNDIHVKANKNSNKLVGDFVVHFTKHLDFSNKFPTSGSKEVSEKTKISFINEIDKWYVGFGDEYITIHFEANGSWTIQAKPDAPLQFPTFTFIVDQEPENQLISINDLDGKFRFQIGYNGSIPLSEQEVIDELDAAIKDLFYQSTGDENLPEYGIDWVIDRPFVTNEEGFIIRPAFYKVIVQDSSNKIAGSFKFGIIGKISPNSL